ncbi:MAG TPA: hypothetical protein VHE32_09225 [Rhodanobacteraceae bacterium]|jgi:hypothetical protein|nr:hypothetical protein [Rhodanobacteraceae bacterium]
MGFPWLSSGFAGIVESAAIALAIGALACFAAHRLGRRVGWRPGTEIGVASLVTLIVAAGPDAWDLFHLSIVRLESPIIIQRMLDGIHDPENLGARVVFEFGGAIAGVMIGWYLATRSPRRS